MTLQITVSPDSKTMHNLVESTIQYQRLKVVHCGVIVVLSSTTICEHVECSHCIWDIATYVMWQAAYNFIYTSLGLCHGPRVHFKNFCLFLQN